MCVCVSICGCKVGWLRVHVFGFSVQGKCQCVGKGLAFFFFFSFVLALFGWFLLLIGLRKRLFHLLLKVPQDWPTVLPMQ